MFDCAAWSTTCMALAHVAVAWAMQDVIPGERRALLTMHFDDIFLGEAGDSLVLALGGLSWHETPW